MSGVLSCTFYTSYTEEVLLCFLPHEGFPGSIFVLFLCGYVCLSFSDILDYGYDVIMLNVIRSNITIKT